MKETVKRLPKLGDEAATEKAIRRCCDAILDGVRDDDLKGRFGAAVLQRARQRLRLAMAVRAS